MIRHPAAIGMVPVLTWGRIAVMVEQAVEDMQGFAGGFSDHPGMERRVTVGEMGLEFQTRFGAVVRIDPARITAWQAHRLIPSETTRQRSGKLSLSEMLFIMVLFHLSSFKHFKAFYHYGIGHQYRACFGDLPHYDRFVSLMPRLFAPLMILLHSLSGESTGIFFADSTKLAVCHNRRIHRHQVFDGLAARGKTSMGGAAQGSARLRVE